MKEGTTLLGTYGRHEPWYVGEEEGAAIGRVEMAAGKDEPWDEVKVVRYGRAYGREIGHVAAIRYGRKDVNV
jgi:hypothetical protein